VCELTAFASVFCISLSMKNKSLGFVRTITYLVLLSLMGVFFVFVFVCLFVLSSASLRRLSVHLAYHYQ